MRRHAGLRLAPMLLAAAILGACGTPAPAPLPPGTNAVRVPTYPTALYFLNAQDGWLASYNWVWPKGDEDQAVFRTRNGGRTWQSFRTGRWKIVRLLFRTPDVGWAIAESSCTNSDTCSRVDILRTVNGGASWSLTWSQKVRSLANTAVQQTLELSFPTDSIGYADVAGRLLATDDGGARWRVLHLPKGETARWISFPLGRQGWVVAARCRSGRGCQSTVLATRDGGRHWKDQLTFADAGTAWYGGIFFLGRRYGWLYSKPQGGEAGVFFRTTTGGRDWRLLSTRLAPGPTVVAAPDFVTAKIGWLAVDAGASAVPGGLLRTLDGGSTWKAYGMREDFRISMTAVDFVTQREGWAIERVGGNPHEALAVSHSGGRSWAPVPVATR